MGLLDHVTPPRRPAKTRSVKTSLMVIGVFLGGTVLSACSQVPDAVNPAEWYRGSVDFFAGEDEDAKKDKDSKDSGLVADRGKAPPGSDKSFPNLSSVDRQARARDKPASGLKADTERPKYAPALPRQGAATEILQAKPRPAPVPAPVTPAPSVAATQPPPSAVPTPTVAQAPLQRPVAQPAPRMAQPSPSPKLSPSVMTANQRETEKRLTRQLAEIRAKAAELGDIPVVSSRPAAVGELATIVISSEGIESDGLMAAAETPKPAQPASPPGQMAAESRLLDTPGALPGTAIKVATILFDNGSSKLKARDKRILSAVVRLQRQNGGRVRVVGHASSRTRNLSPVTHKMTNFKVSIDRADKVAGELMRLGVKEKDILIAAVSDIVPLYYEFMPSGEAGNRRTEVYLVN